MKRVFGRSYSFRTDIHSLSVPQSRQCIVVDEEVVIVPGTYIHAGLARTNPDPDLNSGLHFPREFKS